MITVRRIHADEADILKHVRLASLRDAPYAFGATYDSVLQRTAEIWREKAESTARGSDGATFIAFSDHTPVGMAALFRLPDQVNAGELMQVWIAAEHRGTNVARDLMDAVFQWAGENRFHRVIAGVTKVNARALRFYIKYGFSVMDDFAPPDAKGVYLVKEVNGV